VFYKKVIVPVVFLVVVNFNEPLQKQFSIPIVGKSQTNQGSHVISLRVFDNGGFRKQEQSLGLILENICDQVIMKLLVKLRQEDIQVHAHHESSFIPQMFVHV
jgi:hypothetical protein